MTTRSDEFRHGWVRVRTPASSANLGPGFDALGLALTMSDELQAEIRPHGLQVEVTGSGSHTVPRDETHLVVLAMRATFEEMGVSSPGLALRCENTIPHGKGLGSSAAAIVGGVVLARSLVHDGESRLDEAAALRLAAGMEGHPDNVAASLFGGLVIAWCDDRAERATRLPVDVSVIALIPPDPVSTRLTRELLPAQVPHVDAARNAGRAALLVAALTSSPELLLPATEDCLHQRYRSTAMPDSYELVQRLRADRVPAVISGAGPTVIALSADEDQIAALVPSGWSVERLAADNQGARRLW